MAMKSGAFNTIKISEIIRIIRASYISSGANVSCLVGKILMKKAKKFRFAARPFLDTCAIPQPAVAQRHSY